MAKVKAKKAFGEMKKMPNMLLIIIAGIYLLVIGCIIYLEVADRKFNKNLYNERRSVLELQNKVYELEKRVEYEKSKNN